MSGLSFTPEVEQHLIRLIASGNPSSGIDPAAEQELADAINAHGLHLVDLSFGITRQRNAAMVGPAQVRAAVDAALDAPKKFFDWPAWLGGFFLGVFGNSVPDFFPFDELSPVTVILAMVGLVGAAVCAGFAIKQALT